MGFVFKQMTRWMTLAGTILGAGSTASATDGYFDHGYGVKAKGAGGAGVAFPQDSLAIATNPAGIALLPNRADLGVTWFRPDRGTSLGPADFDGNATDDFLIPELGAVYHLNDRFTFGLATYGNGGMNTDYHDPIPPFGSSDAGVDLSQLFIAPTLTYSINESHSIGFAPIFAYQRFRAKGLENFGIADNGTDTSYGFGARIGYTGKLTDWLTVGATYQSRIFSSELEDYDHLFTEQGDFDIPSNVAVGVAIRPTPQLTLALDVERIFFSEVNSVGNDLSGPRFAAGLGADEGPGFGWDDVTAIKFGVIYDVNDRLTVRAGYNYSTQPIPDNQTFFNILAPAVVQHHLTVGLTYKVTEQVELSAFYTHAFKNTVEGSGNFNNGDADLHMSQDSAGIAIGYLF